MSFAFSKSVGSAGVILMSEEPWDAPRARRPSGPRQAAPDPSPLPLILRIALAYRLRNATLRIHDLPTAFASSSSTSRWQLDYGPPYTLVAHPVASVVLPRLRRVAGSLHVADDRE